MIVLWIALAALLGLVGGLAAGLFVAKAALTTFLRRYPALAVLFRAALLIEQGRRYRPSQPVTPHVTATGPAVGFFERDAAAFRRDYRNGTVRGARPVGVWVDEAPRFRGDTR